MCVCVKFQRQLGPGALTQWTIHLLRSQHWRDYWESMDLIWAVDGADNSLLSEISWRKQVTGCRALVGIIALFSSYCCCFTLLPGHHEVSSCTRGGHSDEWQPLNFLLLICFCLDLMITVRKHDKLWGWLFHGKYTTVGLKSKQPCLSKGFCCCDETLWPKASWEGKGLFCLYFLTTNHHWSWLGQKPGADAEALKGYCLLACFSRLAQPGFL